MSLLIKALKRAEHQNGKSNGAGLTLEPIEEQSNRHAGRRDAQAASAYFAASSRPAGGSLPHWLLPRNWSLVPATLAFATLFVIGYGYYVYLMTRPPVATSASMAQPFRPAPGVAAAPVAMPSPAQTAAPGAASAVTPVEPQPPAEPIAATRRPSAKPEKTVAAAAASNKENEPLVAVSHTADIAPVPAAAAAYRAWQEGRLDEAEAQYRRLAASEPRNLDALLGLAAIAAQKKHPDEAARYYLQALEIEPKNTAAQGGLLGLLGSADPLASETRLKQLLSAHPSAFLYFTLGNLYAEQGKWPAAEQAYFQAQQMEPGNADYAFNLAVSLEHLNQPAIALTYYRRAQQFASRQGGAHFDVARLSEHINTLSSAQEDKR